ncbi:MAG: phosphoribosylanthranilate isomerase [Cyanomargarita calcarea GSE-NOS-MK-12-04C]|uniref:N-(5'-phosphoribosyl)anthranilate isomerase n=1 Tax=Cyanomargarita calcarea GSE-NOS-MK-12-04C TaxID=2839659 RepID=A0A951QLJ6_9CYAN|nr:phosphoribosylanthranilate isomerase [Cyanomargarita calcarea GSE-NOS-MK-12-04C]
MITIPRVKICCISSIEEAWTAIRYGASALGFVSQMPSGPGVISEDLIAKIVAHVPPPIATFLLTSSQEAQQIVEQLKYCRTNTVQICDTLKAGSYQNIRDALPGISIVQVIHVSSQESLFEAVRIAPQVDALLLDSGNQSLQVKELGGTGRIHNWNLSSKIREQVNVPIFLAGGLKPKNVALAVEQVDPFGLDVCSGVRSNGLLDENKLQLFFQNLKQC